MNTRTHCYGKVNIYIKRLAWDFAGNALNSSLRRGLNEKIDNIFCVTPLYVYASTAGSQLVATNVHSITSKSCQLSSYTLFI